MEIDFLTFTDDFSRNNWVYVLKNKDGKLKQWKSSVGNQTSRKFKVLRIANDINFVILNLLNYVKRMTLLDKELWGWLLNRMAFKVVKYEYVAFCLIYIIKC